MGGIARSYRNSRVVFQKTFEDYGKGEGGAVYGMLVNVNIAVRTKFSGFPVILSVERVDACLLYNLVRNEDTNLHFLSGQVGIRLSK